LREQQQNWERLFLATIEMSEGELRAALKAAAPEQRFAAAYVVGEKRLTWTKELIKLLTDPVSGVRQAARRSLMILSFLALNPEEAALIANPNPSRPAKPLSQLKRPVDFGPSLAAGKAAQTAAAKKWTDWWDKQQRTVPGQQIATLSSTGAEPLPETEAGRLAAVFLKAQGERHKELLKEHQETKGADHSYALALAAARLTGNNRREVREALADRMAGLSDATLGRYLHDENAEIRRAAVLGLAMRDSTAHVQRMIDMLLDPEPAVTRAVVAGLRSLSGKDFGPKLHATQEETDEAISRWKQWAAK
jgi:hypothetical protein